MHQESPQEPAEKVVILEADPGYRLAMTRFLSELGLEVVSSDNLSVLRSLKGEPIAAYVIGDWLEPPGERSLFEVLTSLPRGKSAPIIELTSPANAWEGHIQADVHLRKPFQNKQLVRILKYFQQSRSSASPRPELPLPPTVLQDALGFPSQGTLAANSFPSLFVEIWNSAASGALILKSGNTVRRLDFINGLLTFARSNLVTEHLIRFLLRLHVITPDIYRQMLPQAQNAEWDPIVSLVDTGLISKGSYLEAREALVTDIALQCFKWTDAAYRFVDDVLPEPQQCLTDLSPIALYMTWLGDPSNAQLYDLKLTHLLGNGLLATSDFEDNRQLVDELTKDLPPRLQEFDASMSVSSLIRGVDDEEEVKRILVSLVDLHLLRSVPIRKKEPLEAEVASIASAGRKFERIRQMVAEDQARVERAKTPFAILGLAEGASDAEVNARYQRYCRFYKPENFERIGDIQLLHSAQALLSAFRQATSDVLGEVPSEILASHVDVRSPIDSRIRQEEAILAEVLHDDGNTYLKIGDFKEAQEHYRRCTELVPDNPRFLAQLGWVTYQAGKGNMLEVAKAKQTLLNALKMDAQNDRALHYLGCLYEDERQLDKAIDCWTQAVKINPANYEAQSALRRANTR